MTYSEIDEEPEILRIGEPDSPDSDLEAEPEKPWGWEQDQYSKKDLQYEYNPKAEQWNMDANSGFSKCKTTKKQRKENHKDYLEDVRMIKDSMLAANKHRKTKLSKSLEYKKSAGVYSGDTNIYMREIERYIQENVTIRRIHDKLSVS